ncbi:MAG TPA: alpha/beta hydrolase-fold protein [Herpetosiphonaceae bacterium]
MTQSTSHPDLGLVYQLHLPTTPPPSNGYPAVVAIHGRGSNAGDLIELAPYFGADWLTITPQAPFELGFGYHWYEVLRVGDPEPRGFGQSIERLRQFVAKLPTAYPVDPQRIVLMGFSQGAVMSFALALTRPQDYAGIVAMSGYIARQTQQEADREALTGLPILITHGTRDPVIPIDFGRHARDWLGGTSAQVEYHEYGMGHQVSEASLNDVIHWLHQHKDVPQRAQESG